MTESNETKIAVLQKSVADLEKRQDKTDSNIRLGVLALLGVIITGITKVFGF